MSSTDESPIDSLDLVDPSPRARGECHGQTWRREIAELIEIRSELAMRRGAAKTRDKLRALALAHWPIVERDEPDLAAELGALAHAAEVKLADLIVLNQYTDLRDIPAEVVASIVGDHDPGGCTALYCRTSAGRCWLGQTWDMHGTAEPFVRLLRIAGCEKNGEIEPSILTFTLTGCVGMTGLSSHGVGITINNLTSTDARVGLLWPVLVRSMLRCTSAKVARDRLRRAELSSGHHYTVADAHQAFSIECSGTRKVELPETPTASGGAYRLHTNHCLDGGLQSLEALSPASTTHERFELASAMIQNEFPSSAEDMWALLSSHEGHPRSICSHVDDGLGDPSVSRSCGAVVLDPLRRELWSRRGCAAAGPVAHLQLDGSGAHGLGRMSVRDAFVGGRT